MNDDDKAACYYGAGVKRERPLYVPARVRLPALVRGDFPFSATAVPAGDHDCACNQWGAVSVTAADGRPLGIKPAEFEVLAWRDNPHLPKRADDV
jgi:hypothetical protein